MRKPRLATHAFLAGALVAAGCVARRPDRSTAVYVGAGMAGLNNPGNATGDDDNLTLAGGAKVPVGPVSLRPEAQYGDLSWLFTPSATWDFPVAGEGPGSIDGHLGLGYSWLSERENSVLGNTSSPFARGGFEGYLAGGMIVGASLLLAPFGYDHEDLAVGGVAYVGLRF